MLTAQCLTILGCEKKFPHYGLLIVTVTLWAATDFVLTQLLNLASRFFYSPVKDRANFFETGAHCSRFSVGTKVTLCNVNNNRKKKNRKTHTFVSTEIPTDIS